LPDAGTALRLLPELLAAAVVALVSLVTKVSTIEAARRRVADFDRECSACLIVAPLGGVASALQTGISQLLAQAGAVPRRSGVACAVVLTAMAAADLDLPSLVPVPVLAGLVFFLGWTFLNDAVQRPLRQRAWLDLALAALMAVVCLRLGYLWGVLGGVVAACLMFAVSYARIGVVRRHTTAATRASYVRRSAEATRQLRALGPALQVYELGGYLFFGSSEGLLERVRADLDMTLRHAAARAEDAIAVRWVLLDFSGVTGADTSAGLSLSTLAHLVRRPAARNRRDAASRRRRGLRRLAREADRAGARDRTPAPPPASRPDAGTGALPAG
jgi:SulP family sulfate permease